MPVFAGVGQLIGAFVFFMFFVIFLLIVGAIQKASRQSGQAGRSGQPQGGGSGRRPRVPSSGDEVAHFLAELAQQTGAATPRPPRAARPAEAQPQPQPARRPQPEQVARPAVTPHRAQRPSFTPEPQLPRAVSVRSQRKSMKKRSSARPQRPEPPTAPPQTREKHLSASLSDRTKTEADSSPEPSSEPTGAAQRLRDLMPNDPLKQAILLREILGPCRARERFRPGRW